MSVLTAVGAGAVLLFALAAGVWVDRVRRRPIMIAADLGRAILLSTIPLAAALQMLSMTQLYCIAAAVGILTVFFDVAYQSFLPSLVERENVLEGNSKLGMSAAAAEIAGPSITGVLVQLITAPVAILFDAISFLFSAAMIFWIHKPELRTEKAGQRRVRLEIGAGLRTVFHQPVLRALALRSATLNFFAGFFGPLYVLYAIRVLGMGPAALGFTIAVGGAGHMLGSFLAAPVARRFGLGATFVCTASIHGIATLLIPLAGGSLVRAVAFLMAQQLLGDAALVIYFINEVSLRQAIIEDRLLGRVNAGMQLLSRGVWPLGALAAGLLSQAVGVRPALTVAAVGVLLSVMWLVGSPILRLREATVPVKF